jgi:hypothetical protein
MRSMCFFVEDRGHEVFLNALIDRKEFLCFG